jgi:hypothetical protein
VVSARRKAGVGQLMELRLGLLDTHNIGVLFCHPVKKALFGSCTNPVRVQTDDSKQFSSCSIVADMRIQIYLRNFRMPFRFLAY